MHKKRYSEYILKKNPNGSLDYLADFEAMYKNCKDPHHQSLKSNEGILEFDILVQIIKKFFYSKSFDSVIDVGCGLGYFTNRIFNILNKPKMFGCDISNSAIKKACVKFPHLNFFNLNLEKKLDLPQSLLKEMGEIKLVLLTNVIYYVHSNKINLAISNIKKLMGINGLVIFTIHIPEIQNYGKFISNLNSAESLMKKHELDLIFSTEIKSSLDEYNDKNIPINRKHIIFVCKKK